MPGQRGGRGSTRPASRQSSRVGANTSMTTAPRGPTWTSCGTLPGMHQVSPGPSSRASSPTRKAERAAEADAELFVVMAVLVDDAPWIEFDHAEGEARPVHDPSV